MSKTLILVFHPDLGKSHANAALAKAASALPDVEVVDMHSRYPSGAIDMFSDGEREVEMLFTADRLVLQFPIQWYSTPALLKTWQDEILMRMYYVFAETEGPRFTGTPLMIAATAGNVPEAYSRSGENYFSVDEILTPLKATSYRCGLTWHDPYILFRANKLEDDALEYAAAEYAHAIQGFIAATPTREKAA
ncbi:NAD(P)H-dependent oxidoreductase [Rhodobacteraceae bacterium NNCM2]|nr:NAD(P)H-dependent oxidoreductase [Coraliihabitans acroporae]